MKNIIILALVCIVSFTANAAQSDNVNTTLNPMESFVCPVDSDYSIVRNDETRRNVFTLRHRETLELAFDAKFEKYLNQFEIDGMPFIAVGAWNPAFGYLWGAWLRDARGWQKVLPMQYTDIKIVPNDNKPTSLQCTGMDGKQMTVTLNELIANICQQ